MRSREPWRLPAGQSRAVPFLQAAVLFAALPFPDRGKDSSVTAKFPTKP